MLALKNSRTRNTCQSNLLLRQDRHNRDASTGPRKVRFESQCQIESSEGEVSNVRQICPEGVEQRQWSGGIGVISDDRDHVSGRGATYQVLSSPLRFQNAYIHFELPPKVVKRLENLCF